MPRTRFILTLLAVLSLSSLYASHLQGGYQLSYKSAPGPHNDSLRYEVTLIYLNRVTANGHNPISLRVDINSSCFSTGSVQLYPYRVGSFYSGLSSLDYCSGTSPSPGIGYNVFKGFVSLPGVCNDYRFSFKACCDIYSSNNISSSSSQNAYVYADLNNTLEPNSTPRLDSADVVQFTCTNRPIHSYRFIEDDRDSVFYSSSAPNYSTSNNSILEYAYKPGYSVSNPVGSSSGFMLDSSSGAMQTSVDSAGYYIITIKYEEYRKDSSGTYIKISEGRCMPLLGITNHCLYPNFDLQHMSSPLTDTVDCGARTLTFRASRKISKSSVTYTGSEFLINASSSGNLAIQNVQVVSDSVIQVHLIQPIPAGQTIIVNTQTGTDGNTILSVCGQDISNLSQLTFYSRHSPAAQANFTAIGSLSGISFNSAGSVGSYFFWDLGDGNTATGDSVNHVYSSPGAYWVTLMVVNSCLDSAVYSDTVKVCAPMAPGFTYQILSSNGSGSLVQFDASASQAVDTYLWDFGDGSFGMGVSPQHWYVNPASNIIVKLIAYNFCNEDSTVSNTIVNLGLDKSSALDFQVYPNPFSNELFFSGTLGWWPEKWTLHNVQGEKVREGDLVEVGSRDRWSIKMADLPSGVYSLILSGDNNQRYSRTLVKL